MQLTKARLTAFFCLVLFPRVVIAACATDRAPVKGVTDADASQVSRSVMPTPIGVLHSIPAPRPLPQDRRVAPAETTIYSVTATLVAYRLTPEAEIELVLSDEARRTIIATIPSPACAAGSAFAEQIANVRTSFERRYTVTPVFKETRQAVEVQGVGFFAFFQGQRGLAPNGLSLHPVIAIDFTPSFKPRPPAQTGRRRSAGSGGQNSCAPPSLNISASRVNACTGEAVTLTWDASDPAAQVSIDGIGVALPSSGARVVSVNASTVYSGRARTACGTGLESLAVVNLAPAATASLSGPGSLTAGNTGRFNVAVSAGASWTLTSSLGNAISPSSGTSNWTVSYTARLTGTDTLTLMASGGACGRVTKTQTIFIGASPPPPPPPSGGGLLCCDGTRSKTCFSCSNKQGCCSGHKGVCGCG